MKSCNRKYQAGTNFLDNRSSGFTLIELLVSIAMFSLFSAAAMAILIPLSRSYTVTDVASSAQQVVRMAVRGDRE